MPRLRRGKQQLGPLRLDLRKVPKGKDIARTIAHEWIVSQRLGELMIDHGLTGVELRRVVHKYYFFDAPVYLDRTPTAANLPRPKRRASSSARRNTTFGSISRRISRCGSKQGICSALKEEKALKRGKPMPVWYQLVPSTQPVEAMPLTKTGIDPFDEDVKNEYRCPRGDLIGLNLLSEVYVDRGSYDGSDVAITRQFVGKANSWLLSPVLLISQRFRQLLEAEKIKGYTLEVRIWFERLRRAPSHRPILDRKPRHAFEILAVPRGHGGRHFERDGGDPQVVRPHAELHPQQPLKAVDRGL